MTDATLRARLAQQLEDEIRPRLDLDKGLGGYDCCGCSTYGEILDHALRIVRGSVRTVHVDTRYPAPDAVRTTWVAWLHEHGIAAGDVVADPTITVDDQARTITYTTQSRDENGRPRIVGNGVLREERTVTCDHDVAPFPTIPEQVQP